VERCRSSKATGPIPEFLAKKRKYAILINFIIAAILTPTPDIFNQALMAGPLIILYEIGIIGAKIFCRERRKKEEEVNTI
jgi:sec-independent protein translocase protein TatC